MKPKLRIDDKILDSMFNLAVYTKSSLFVYFLKN